MSKENSLTIVRPEPTNDALSVGREFVRLAREEAQSRGGPGANAVCSLAAQLLSEIEAREQHHRRLAAEVLRPAQRALGDGSQ